MTQPRTAPTTIAVLAVLFMIGSAAAASAQEVRVLTPQFAGLADRVENLQVFEVGGIVVLRGKTDARSVALAAGERAQLLGYERVANLIQIHEVPDDAAMRREAQRELAIHHSLAGSRISVDAENGILYLRGSVEHEMQEDLAVAVLRSLDGVREVRAQLRLR